MNTVSRSTSGITHLRDSRRLDPLQSVSRGLRVFVAVASVPTGLAMTHPARLNREPSDDGAPAVATAATGPGSRPWLQRHQGYRAST